MFPGYVPKNPLAAQNLGTTGFTQPKMGSTYYGGETKDINVIQNRVSQQAINIDHNPSDVEQRL